MRPKELKDIVISALLLALAFGIAFSGGFRAFSSLGSLAIMCLMSVIAVSLGFVLHELGHRFVARRFGCYAEYTMWPTGLILALVFSFFGFIFAAPGAVMIYPRADMWGRAALTRGRMGIIAITGPVINLSLAVVFIFLDITYAGTGYLGVLFYLGARINTWLAIFNLIPFGPLDGGKVFRWHKGVWIAALAVGIGLFLVENFVL